MKIWLKMLIGILLGIAAFFLLPVETTPWQNTLNFLAELTLRLGRYIAFPLFFFSLATGVHELKREKQIVAVPMRILLYTVLLSLSLVLLGTLLSVFLSTPRIPIVVESQTPPDIMGLKEALRGIFPYSAFQIFGGNPQFFLPLYVLSFILGLHFSFDRTLAAPAHDLIQSLALVFYHINSLFLEIVGIGMIFFSTLSIVTFQQIVEPAMFTQDFILLSFLSVLILGGFLPGLYYILSSRQENPYRILYGNLGPLLAGFFSGDIYFSTGILFKHSQENMGIPRRINAVSLPFSAMFGKGGTGLVAAVSMVIILQSYSSLEITFFQILWVFFFSFLVSFILPAFPGQSVLIAQILLCQYYGRGLEEGYLILKPIIPFLISFSTLLDTAGALFVALLTAEHEGCRKEVELKEYI